MDYAKETSVPVMQTKNEIETLVAKWKADAFFVASEPERAIIGFRLQSRNIRFTLPLPAPMDDAPERGRRRRDQELRSRWRRLLLVIKAKFESIESEIETLEEAFLAHIQMANGRTVMEEIREPLALNYSGQNVPLLMGPRETGGER